MRVARVLLLTAVLSTPALAMPRLELEVSAGAWALQGFTPNFSTRVGLDLFGWLTPSVRVQTINKLGSDPTALAFLAEGRLHNKGIFQVTGGIGVGVATASVSPGGSSAARAAPYFQGDIGFRVMIGPVWIGAGVGGNPTALTWQGMLNVGVGVFGGDD